MSELPVREGTKDKKRNRTDKTPALTELTVCGEDRCQIIVERLIVVREL